MIIMIAVVINGSSSYNNLLFTLGEISTLQEMRSNVPTTAAQITTPGLFISTFCV